MAAQGYGTADPVGAVDPTQVNVNMADPLTLQPGATANYGLHFTAYEDHINNKKVVYATRHTPNTAIPNQGSTQVMAFEFVNNTTLVQEHQVYQIENVCDNSELGELQIAPEGDKLLWYQHNNTIAGFDHRLVDIYTIELHADKISTTGTIDIINHTQTGNYGGNYGEGNVETEKMENGVKTIYFSQRGIYENPTTGNERNTWKWKYIPATIASINPLNLTNVVLFSEMRRGVDGKIYMPNLSEPVSAIRSYDGTNFGNTTLTGYTGLSGYEYASALPTQVYKIYADAMFNTSFTRTVNQKQYELKDHLGSVRVVISDRKLLTQADNTKTTIEAGDYFSPEVKSFSDTYPFGMVMPGRKLEGSYRYGFQGQEKENDVVEGGFAFRYRIQDARIGRFLSVDPLSEKYAWNSTYSFAMNRVIDGIELEGLEYLDYGVSRVKIMNGEIHINIENFHNTTKNAWKMRDAMGNYPNKDKFLGASTLVQDFDMPGTKSAKPISFGSGTNGSGRTTGLAKIDPTSIQLTNNNGKLHWDSKNFRINGRNKKTPVGGGAAGAVDALNWGLNQVTIWQQYDDRQQVEQHKSIILNQVMKDIAVAIKMAKVPPEYLNDRSLGDIANIVLTGVNLTQDNKLYDIAIDIVKTISKNYKPKYEVKHYTQNQNADNTNLQGTIKILTQDELDSLEPVDTGNDNTTNANEIEGVGVKLPK